MRVVSVAFFCAVFAPPAITPAQTPITRTLSRPQVEFSREFSDVGAVRELRDGRVIVVDARELIVLILDPRTQSATTIGRAGEGPGEYRWPSKLFPLAGDSTLLQDAAAGRLMIITPDGKAGGFLDPNRSDGDTIATRINRFFVRAGDGRGLLYGEAQPIRIGANGVAELADHSAIERFEVSTRKRDTVALRPVRHDANARLVGGMVITQPRIQPFPAWEHWAISSEGRIAFVNHEPYRVDFVGNDGKVVQNEPIPFDRVRVDDALKKQYREERERPSMAMMYTKGGGSTMQLMSRPFREPPSWPEFLPPFLGSSIFGPDGLLWIPRAVAAGKPPLYDIVDGNGRLVERVQLPQRTKLVGFGVRTVFVVRIDDDGLQYLQRHALPTLSKEPPRQLLGASPGA